MRPWPVLVLPCLFAALVVACSSSSGPLRSTFDRGGTPEAGTSDGTTFDASFDLDAFKDIDGCAPRTCKELGFTCGINADQCGSTVDCGACAAPELCGGGGFSRCGGDLTAIEAGGDLCQPQGCAPSQCGPAGDGCGHTIQCSTCAAPTFCGGGGPSVCGGVAPGDGGSGSDAPVCVPLTCADQHMACGPAGDGCGNPIAGGCGSCPSPGFCGGGGFAQCGGNAQWLDAGGDLCKPETCAAQHIACGPAGDGCGNTIATCGACAAPATCGGGGVFAQCGSPPPPACTGLCLKQVACAAGLTSVSGQVVAGTLPQYLAPGASPDPVPNVLVYVPNGAVLPFTANTTCSQCGADITGSPLVETTTAVDGTFTLKNVPVMANMPLVIQLGRWRRQLTVTTSACVNTAMAAPINLPRTKADGDIPLTAVSTGNVDGLECVLLKMGVDVSEFTEPTASGGTGRIQLYVGNGANAGVGTPTEAALVNTPATLAQYDEVLFPCWGDAPTSPGSPTAKSATQQENVIDYTSNGGRVFATHFSYGWLYDAPPFSTTATWDVNADSYPSVYASVDTSSAQTSTFSLWMQNVGATNAAGLFNVTQAFHDFDAVVAPSQRWAYTTDHEGFPLQYTFDTPIGASAQCGRVVFSDFHVTTSTGMNQSFPSECTTAPMSAQEKALEYLLWDLAACNAATPPACVPTSCVALGYTCGTAADGCGGVLQCGPCPAGEYCGGAGQPYQCGVVDGGSCASRSCADQGIQCGPTDDGCGTLLQCGPCPAGQACGIGGQHGVCAPLPVSDAGDAGDAGCVKLSCGSKMCGQTADGCGGLLDCGSCPAPLVCGGAGVSWQCGALVDGGAACVGETCAALGLHCGPTGDGCGKVLDCGNCTAPETCGGGGTVGVCGGGNGQN